MSERSEPMTATPDVERQLVADMLRRGLPAVPVVMLVAGLFAGWAGVASAGYGMGIVAINLVLAAVALAWAARISPGALMATALGGFLVRMGTDQLKLALNGPLSAFQAHCTVGSLNQCARGRRTWNGRPQRSGAIGRESAKKNRCHEERERYHDERNPNRMAGAIG